MLRLPMWTVDFQPFITDFRKLIVKPSLPEAGNSDSQRRMKEKKKKKKNPRISQLKRDVLPHQGQ